MSIPVQFALFATFGTGIGREEGKGVRKGGSGRLQKEKWNMKKKTKFCLHF